MDCISNIFCQNPIWDHFVIANGGPFPRVHEGYVDPRGYGMCAVSKRQ